MAWVDYIHSRGKNVVYDVQAELGPRVRAGHLLPHLERQGRPGHGPRRPAGQLVERLRHRPRRPAGRALQLRRRLPPRLREAAPCWSTSPASRPAPISVGAGYRGLDGTARTSVSVAGRDGVGAAQGRAASPSPEPDARARRRPPTRRRPSRPRRRAPEPDARADPGAGARPGARRRPAAPGPAAAPVKSRPSKPRRGKLVLSGRIARSKRARASRRLTVSVVLRTADGRRLVRRVSVRIGRGGRFRAVLDSVPHGQLPGRASAPWAGAAR